jgi:hypothetical protein
LKTARLFNKAEKPERISSVVNFFELEMSAGGCCYPRGCWGIEDALTIKKAVTVSALPEIIPQCTALFYKGIVGR